VPTPFPQYAVLSSYEDGTAVSDFANVAVFQFQRTPVGLGVKYSVSKYLLRPQVEISE